MLQAGFFIAPIIYPLEILPERFHFYLYLWPPTPVIEFSRAVLVRGVFPTPTGHLYLAVEAMVCLGDGHPDLSSAQPARGGAPVAMPLIEVDGVSKAFWIPSVRRETVREHLLGMLQPRRFQRLQVLEGVSVRVAARRGARHHGAQRLGQEHAPEDHVRRVPTRPGARQHPGGDHADPRARRRLESRARCRGQRAAHRIGDGAVARRNPQEHGGDSGVRRARTFRDT